jgi:hypothetical protein
MGVFTSRSRDQLPIFSVGSRSSHRDQFLPTHLPRFRTRCARSSPSPLLALERSFLPARHSRYQFRIMVRYLRLLQRALLSSASARSLLVVLIARGSMTICFTAFAVFDLLRFSKATFYVSWRHRLRDICLNAALLFSKATSGGHTSDRAPQLYAPPLGGKDSLSAYWYRYARALCTAAWFLPFHTRGGTRGGGSDPSGR